MSRRRGIGDHKPGGNQWLTTFNDMVTLLMVFFVMLFSMSSLDYGKMKRFQKSLSTGLGILYPGDKTRVGASSPGGTPAVSERNAELAPGTSKMLAKAVSKLNRIKGMRAKLMGNGARLTVENAVLFEFGAADLTPGASADLRTVCDAIRDLPFDIRVEGHTDNVPIHTARYPSNWELSMARAVRVVKFFIAAGRISPRRLSAAGYADCRPVMSNDTPEGRARNRRVEIFLIAKER
jgi:chemotaxis protein MotB